MCGQSQIKDKEKQTENGKKFTVKYDDSPECGVIL